jgi:Cu2+-exporting ATPase
VTEADALTWAAALEQLSEHPIARAFAGTVGPGGAATEVEVHAGRGLEGRVAGRRLRIGTAAFAAELGAATDGSSPAANLSSGTTSAVGGPTTSLVAGDGSGESWIHLGGADGLLASFRLTDPSRAEAIDCVARLGKLGLSSEIVSGDEPAAVARIAMRCDIAHHAARLAPAEKLARLKALQAEGAVVVAVGDGINDAPLLEGADVAVAMGRGSALAQTSADLILVRDGLDDLPETVHVARRTARIVRQNLGWAIGYNLAALPLAAFGLVPPWLAAIGMSLSSVVVVLNAMRLSRQPSPGHRAAWPAPRPAEAA